VKTGLPGGAWGYHTAPLAGHPASDTIRDRACGGGRLASPARATQHTPREAPKLKVRPQGTRT